jgi:diaminopimelate epimerase
MKCHLYSAAGNRILWLEALEADYDHLKASGFALSRPFQLGQEMTAILGGSEHARYALFWNPDGTYEMVCGNAIRCLAHFICEGSASADAPFGSRPRASGATSWSRLAPRTESDLSITNGRTTIYWTRSAFLPPRTR